MSCLICINSIQLHFNQNDLELLNSIKSFCDLLSLKSFHDELYSFSSENSELFCRSCLDRLISVSQLLNELQEIQNKLEEFKETIQGEIVESFKESRKLKRTTLNKSYESLQNIRKHICIHLSLLLQSELNQNDEFEQLPEYVEIKTEDEYNYESESSCTNSPFNDDSNEKIQSLKEKALKNDSFLKIKRLEDLTTEEIGEEFSSSVDANQNDDSNSSNEESSTVQDDIESIAKLLITKGEKPTTHRKIIKNIPKADESTNDEPPKAEGFRIRKYRRIFDDHSRKKGSDLKFIPTCRICSNEFKTQDELKVHHLEAHNNQIVKCPDPKCTKMYPSMGSSREHYNRVHLRIRRNKIKKRKLCPICGKYVTELAHHMKIHKERETFECEICKKVLISKESHKAHYSMFHSDTPKQNFVCPTCGKILSTINSLKLHEKAVHERNYKFKCDVCDFGAETMGAFKKHQLTHTEEKPFICTEPGCDQKYKSKGGLSQHKLIHTGERPHKCKICGKGFRSTGQMNVHETTHTPHITTCECEICGKKFTHKTYLLLHLNWHKRVEARGKGPAKSRTRKPKELANEIQQ